MRGETMAIAIEKHGQGIGSGMPPIANLPMAFGALRGCVVAEGASDAGPAYGTSTARGLAANRCAEVFLDL